MFENAARLKLRFNTPVGNLSVEDLWDLPLTKLNIVAQTIHREIKNGEEESFIATPTNKDTVLVLKLDILKHIIKVRMEENAANLASKATLAKREKILGLIEKKKDEDLGDLSVEELEALL